MSVDPRLCQCPCHQAPEGTVVKHVVACCCNHGYKYGCPTCAEMF